MFNKRACCDVCLALFACLSLFKHYLAHYGGLSKKYKLCSPNLLKGFCISHVCTPFPPAWHNKKVKDTRSTADWLDALHTTNKVRT